MSSCNVLLFDEVMVPGSRCTVEDLFMPLLVRNALRKILVAFLIACVTSMNTCILPRWEIRGSALRLSVSLKFCLRRLKDVIVDYVTIRRATTFILHTYLNRAKVKMSSLSYASFMKHVQTKKFRFSLGRSLGSGSVKDFRPQSSRQVHAEPLTSQQRCENLPQ